MDLSYTPEYKAYRADLRAFLEREWDPQKARDRQSGEAYVSEFRRKATEKGYLYRAVPKRYGGSEQPADVLQVQIIQEAFARARAPMEVVGNGMLIVVPTLLEVGAEWQKEMFVEKTVLGEYRWAQGYSEPGSGSDLASIKTRAELDGDEWVINGQKIWTTMAHTATHMFALCRTEPDAPKHAGISYMLMDFKQPGITIRPIKQISGAQEFSETFLDNARTPKDWIVGERGKGWAVSKVNLKHERNNVGSATRTVGEFEKLVTLAKRTMLNGKPAIEDPSIRMRLVTLEGYMQAHLWSGYYQQTLASRGESAGPLSMMNKLNMSNMGQTIAGIATDVLGPTALLAPSWSGGPMGDERWLNQIFGSIAMAIAGGTSNIQRGVIAERGYDLPREQLD